MDFSQTISPSILFSTILQISLLLVRTIIFILTDDVCDSSLFSQFGRFSQHTPAMVGYLCHYHCSYDLPELSFYQHI